MSSPSPLDVRDQIWRLRVFLRWLIPVAGTFATLELVAWRVFDDGQSLGAGVVIWAYVVVACAALWRLQDGRLTEAALALSVGTMVMAIVLATLQPVIYPPLIVVALMATGLALSYLDGRALIVSLVASWICAVTIVAVGLLSPSPSPLPTWFVVVFDVAGVAAATGLALILLSQSHDRLVDSLVKAQRANDDLLVAQAERLAAERRLAVRERHESLGILAGGVAHDFNNLLTAVIGNAELVRADLPVPTSPSIDGSLTAIETSARRAADLARQMQAYAGRSPTSVERLDPNEVVRELIADLRSGIAHGIRLEITASAPDVRIEADREQLRQAVTNLVANSAEAIATAAAPEDPAGRITVAVGAWVVGGSADLPSDAVAPDALETGRYATIAVDDTGPGVTPEIARRMFEPFVTSRFTGRGLGLAVVLGVARSHGGSVVVRSDPGRGMTVTILLPLAV